MKIPYTGLIKKIVGLIVILLVGIFIVQIFISHTKQIQDSLALVSWVNILLSIIMFLGYFYARALSWNLILKSLGNHFKVKDSLFAWFAGEATRYIPGNIWSFASRYYLSYTKGIPKANVILSMLLEILIFLPVTLLLSIPAILENYGKINFNGITILVIFVILGIAVVGFFFNKRVKQLVGRLQTIPRNILSSRTFWEAVFLQMVSWTVFGLGNYFLIQPFASHISIALLVSISIFAWFVGYVSIVTPMGLGVREGAIILLLGSSIGQGQAGLAAVLSRVVLTAAEVINLLFWFLVNQRNTKLLNN